MRNTMVLLLAAILMASACGDDDDAGGGGGEPVVSFDGAECVYSGPDSLEAGLNKVTFTNTSGEAGFIAGAQTAPGESGEDVAASVVEAWVNPTSDAGSAVVFETNMPSAGTDTEKSTTFALIEGTITVVCLSNLSNTTPDHHVAARTIEVG